MRATTIDDAVVDDALAAKVDEAIGDDDALAAKVDEAIGDNGMVGEDSAVVPTESTPEHSVPKGQDKQAPATGSDVQDVSGTKVIDEARRGELLRGLFHCVRLDLCDAFPDPRCDITGFTMEAFTQVLPGLPKDVSEAAAYEEVMDKAVQLAADDRERFEQLRGTSHVHVLSLQVLYGFKLKKEQGELRSVLAAIDDLPEAERTVFQLQAFYGWSNAHTARVLDISEGQASKIMTRATKKLATSTGVSVKELRTSFFEVEIARRKQ